MNLKEVSSILAINALSIFGLDQFEQPHCVTNICLTISIPYVVYIVWDTRQQLLACMMLHDKMGPFFKVATKIDIYAGQEIACSFKKLLIQFLQ